MKVILATLFLVVFPASFGQVPGTPAGCRLSEWVRMFNSNTNLEKHIGEAFTSETPASMRALFQGARRYETRGYEIRAVETSEPHTISVLAQGKLTQLWYRLTLTVEPDSPHRISKYEAPHIPTPRQFHLPLSEQQVLDELKALLNRMSRVDAFSGAVLVARGDKVLFRAAYGYVDAGHRIKNRLDTKFNLASVNKMFTAVAIMQLVEAGRLRLDDPVGLHLPEYANETVRTQVTVRQLLCHMSGLGDYFNERYYAARENLREVKDYIPLFADQKLEFDPGKGYTYSNAGYIVLGRIIEVVSRQSYFDYVQEKIFRPAGMSRTDSYELDYDTPGLATGYTHMSPSGRPDFSRRRKMLYNEGVKGSPAGHGYSTVDDLFRFCRQLRAGKLVSQAGVREMTKPQAVSGDPNEQYGFGFEILPGLIVGHTGGGRGGMAMVEMFEKGDYTVIVLSNYQRGGNLVAYRLRDLLSAIKQ